jgi:hypothetical protein
VDALLVGYYVGKELHFAAKVRAGFVPRLRRNLFVKLTPLEKRYRAGEIRVPVDYSQRIGELEQEIRNLGDAIAKGWR